MEEETKVNWIDKMIEREAIPKQLRQGSNEEFCAKYGISDSLYYYHSSKPEIKAKIVEIALTNAKKYVPEVLENLGERAQSDNKAAELYIKFILQLAEKTDITTKGEKIVLDSKEFDAILNAYTNRRKEDSGS